MVSIQDRVICGGALATVVGRIDALYVELRYDKKQPRTNIYDQPYETEYECAHIDLLVPADGLW